MYVMMYMQLVIILLKTFIFTTFTTKHLFSLLNSLLIHIICLITDV